MKRAIAGRRACSVAALVMRRRTVWFLNAVASSPLAMMRILPWSMRSRPNGGPAQPTSIWPDITCVKVDAGLPVATGFALRSYCRMKAETMAWVEAPLVE